MLRPEGRRILVSAPFGRDGESLAALLHDQGYNAIVCRDLTVIADSVGEVIGVIVLTEEALNGNVERLKQKLQQQPSWSDIPFLLLAAPRNSRSPNAQLSKLALFDLASNSVVLERPIGKASLYSALASAMRLREKQFQMRDRMAELDESETRLRLANSAASIGTWDFNPVDNVCDGTNAARLFLESHQMPPFTYEESFFWRGYTLGRGLII
ncbi:hypothetical protein RMS29_015680 [Agrobacterium rosae]|uniref:hypothetical protein n=1 Tax=Agrobacterium rosae TaxID=1972867 RepID=UPI003D7A9D23